MATELDITLSSTLLTALQQGGNTASSIYVVAYDTTSSTGTLTPLFTDGSLAAGAVSVAIDGSLSGEAIPFPLPDPLASGKIYLLVQSVDNNSTLASLPSVITQQSDINAADAAAYHFAYDSIELNLTGTATDAGNLTSVVQYGLPMAIGVTYTNGASASVGYAISGTSLQSGLVSAGATITTFGTGPLADSLQSALPPTNAGDWTSYVSSLEGPQAGSIEISGFFNGAKDAGGTYHNAGYFAYTLSWDAADSMFWLDPLASSQIKGAIELSPTALENSIYQTNGSAEIFTNPADPTAYATINTGANDEWGTVLRQLLVGFNAGYYESTGAPLNAQLGLLAGGGTVDLNNSIYWDPSYAFGQNLTSHPAFYYNNSYASVITDHSNSYGFGYSDAETAAYAVGGPLLALAEPGTTIDVGTIDLTLFGNTDTPTGYTTPVINNVVDPPGNSFAAASDVSSNNIVLDFSTGGPTNAGVVLNPDAVIVLGILTSDVGGVPTFANVTLDGASTTTIDNAGLWRSWDISSAGGTYSATPTTLAQPAGSMLLQNLPLNDQGGVTWLRVTEELGGAAKTFNLYMTAARETATVTGTLAGSVDAATVTGGTLGFDMLSSGTIVAGTITGATITGTGPQAIAGGSLVAGLASGVIVASGSIDSGTVGGTLSGYDLNGLTITDGTLTGGSLLSGTSLDGGTITSGLIGSAEIGSAIFSGGTTIGGISMNGSLTGATIYNATLTGGVVTLGALTSETISLGAIAGNEISGGTIISQVALENPYAAGQTLSAGVDGLGIVQGATGASTPAYIDSLTYNLAGSTGQASVPDLLTANSATTLVSDLMMPNAPVAGTLDAGGTFTALGGQSLQVANTITTGAQNLAFAWTGENDATGTTSWISGYTNKINAGDIARITLTPQTGSTLYTTATADIDGQWQTGTLDLPTGTYSVTMRDYLASDTSFASALTPESSALVLVETSTPCFCHGTRIRTDRGEIAVEALAIGDRVATAANGYRPIKWLGRRSYLGAFAARNRKIWPVRIKAGALDGTHPLRDLCVSPEHALYLDQCLVPARHLVNGRSITIVENAARIDYVHIELETHDLIFAEGALTETFLDRDSRAMFHNADEFPLLYPHDGGAATQGCAPLLEGGRKLRALQLRLLAAARAPAAGLSLRGYIDEAARDLVRGWAWHEADPDAVAELDIWADGKRLGRVLANTFRADLAEAGIGNGCHGFSFRLPRPLDPAATHEISVRGAGCGTALIGGPVRIEPGTGMDVSLLRDLRAQLHAAAERSSSLAEARALLGMLEQAGDELKQRHARLAEAEAPRRKVAKRARRALVIDDAWPRVDRNAGAQAVLSHMRALQQLGWQVFFTARTGAAADETAISRLQAQNIACLAPPAIATVEEALARQAGQFDLVYLHRVSVAAPYLSLARQHQPQARILYSVADLHHLRLARQASAQDRPELRAAARRARQQEFFAAASADIVITHSPAEAAQLRADRALAPERLHVVPWAVPLRRAAPAKHADPARRGLLFVGNFSHEPNLDGLEWLVEAILPLLRARLPDQEFVVAGAGLPADLAPWLEERGVTLAGGPAELTMLYATARLALAPLRFGAGLKGKVLEAWAHGVPCVMTPIAAEGFGADPALASAIAADAPDFAAAILRLLGDARARTEHVAAGQKILRAQFSAGATKAALAAALRPAMSGHQVAARRPA